MTAGLTMTVEFQCMFLNHYSHLDPSQKVVERHLDVHMLLEQGPFTLEQTNKNIINSSIQVTSLAASGSYLGIN